MDMVTGSTAIPAVINGTLGLINNMKETSDRELALLRLLYLEINQNLEVLSTIKWAHEAGVPCTDQAYKEIANGLCYEAHQAILTTRVLDTSNLMGWKIGDQDIKVNRTELDEEGVMHAYESPMTVAQALKFVCVKMGALQRMAAMDVSPEIGTKIRYSIRLENIQSYLVALHNKLLESKQIQPLETL